MEPHMIEIELFSYLFVIGINHVGFIIPDLCMKIKNIIIIKDEEIIYIYCQVFQNNNNYSGRGLWTESLFLDVFREV
jgi:hypothetical protein